MKGVVPMILSVQVVWTVNIKGFNDTFYDSDHIDIPSISSMIYHPEFFFTVDLSVKTLTLWFEKVPYYPNWRYFVCHIAYSL